jgi:hypothetical protein
MRVLVGSLLSLLIVISNQSQAGLEDLLSKVPDKKEMALSAFRALPERQQQGVRDYLSSIGIEVSGSHNKGFRQLNESLLEKIPACAVWRLSSMQR